MAPSRGFSTLLRARYPIPLLTPTKRTISQLAKAATNPEHKSQIYISRTLDPYLNLSIEHYLLTKTPPESTILFLYTNKPCIVIGRNQNPWLEVNLGMLGGHSPKSWEAPEQNPSISERNKLEVQLVRRRSGGGTVFHDEGNMNYSVICPTSAFDRDKHAEMVVRALQKSGVEKTRVNERHDIVLEKLVKGEEREFKVSGSAYKLTRLRSLHHGTCLLNSRNIKTIGKYLRSPAQPYITAKGVESVWSPVTNIGIADRVFEKAVVKEFSAMYEEREPLVLFDEEAAIPEILTGYKELKDPEWIYGQTPKFEFRYAKKGANNEITSLEFKGVKGRFEDVMMWTKDLEKEVDFWKGVELNGTHIYEHWDSFWGMVEDDIAENAGIQNGKDRKKHLDLVRRIIN